MSGSVTVQNRPTEIYEYLERLCRNNRSVMYKGIPLFLATRMSILLMLRDRLLRSDRNPLLERVRLLLWCIRELAVLFRWRRTAAELYNGRGSRRKWLFVIDHDSVAFLEMQLALVREFDPSEVVVVTQDEQIYRRLRGDLNEIHLVRRLQQQVPIRWQHVKTAFEITARAELVRPRAVLFRPQLWLAAVRTMKLIDFYERALDLKRIAGTVTLSDTHNHEFVVSNVANKNRLQTCTLQHGLMDIPDTPISAKRIFVWGESTREILLRLGVSEDKIDVAGRPGLDDELRRHSADGPEIRAEFCRTYGLTPDRLMVTYFASNWGPEENRGLFDCFADICDLNVSPVVKLKSNAGEAMIQTYQAWLRERKSTARVPIVTAESPWQCFQVSDVVITCHSTVGMEALAFGVIVVLLEKYPYMDLAVMLPHYADAIIVNNGSELRTLVERLVSDRAYADALRKRSRERSRRHFANSIEWDASRHIAHEMRSACDAR